MSAAQIPRVGVGVFVLNRENKFVFGRRKGSLGNGHWALPGGHLDLGETFERCAEREVMEETGLAIKNISFLTATNGIRIDGSKHYVTIFMVAEQVNESQRPINVEPDKCDGWTWVSWDQMELWHWSRRFGAAPSDQVLFQPLEDLIDQRPGLRPSLLTNNNQLNRGHE